MKRNIREVLYHDSNPEPPAIVYHYCSVQAMLSILDNSCIWMTDSKKTNDRTEIKWILNNVNQVFEESIEKFRKKYDSDIFQQIRDIVYELIKENVLANPFFIQRDFLSCFSTHPDMLSQWRAYGNNGCGVSLGFDSNCLKMLKNYYDYDFIKVLYVNNPKDILHKFVDKHLENIIIDCITKNTIMQEIIDLKRQIYLIAYDAYQYGYRIKNETFREEDEWRLHKRAVCFYENELYESDNEEPDELLDGIFSDNRMGEYTRSKIKYRAKESDIIGYLELGFNKVKTKIIKEIILGPKCLVDFLDLKIVLAENNYIESIYDSSSITIKESTIPYI